MWFSVYGPWWLGDREEGHLACKKYCHNNSQKWLLGTGLTRVNSSKMGQLNNLWVCICVYMVWK